MAPSDAEHPERAQPALGEHREAADRHQGDEEHPDRGQCEEIVSGLSGLLGATDARGLDVRSDRTGAEPGGVEEDRHLGRCGDLSRADEGELVEQALGVLRRCRPRCAGRAVLVPDVTDLQVEVGGHTAGHRHLARRGRVVTRDERQHRLAERSVRVLGAQVVGVDRARNREGLVLDDVDLPEAMLQAARSRWPGSGRIPGTWRGPRRCRTRTLAGGGVSVATAAPTMVAATATTTSARISSCWRHSRRNRRQAQRTMARRAGSHRCRAGSSASAGLSSVTVMIAALARRGPARGGTRGSAAASSGRRRVRRGGRPPGPPTRPAGRRG